MKPKDLNILKKGIYRFKDKIAPSYVNLSNPKYIEIDNIYYSGIIISDYYREADDLIFKNIINSNINITVSCFYEKQDTYKTIKELTYYIGNSGVEMQNNNKQDIDIIAFSHNDAKYIRREMQINNENLYYIYTYAVISSNDKKELENTLNRIGAIFSSVGMVIKPANFRQEQVFKACIPTESLSLEIKECARRNVLTSGLVATYPFVSSNVFEENGIYIGKNMYDDSLIFIDRFNKDIYKNANMCVFGTSGAGKSFFIKTQILRYRLEGIEQYVVDPEREYVNLCKNLGGSLIKIGASASTYINILDIRENSIEEQKGFLANKILKLMGFFKLVFGNLDEEEKAILEEKLIICYKEKGITFDDKSLYKENSEKITIKPIFKTSEDMPILEDLYNILSKDEKTRKMKIKLTPFISGSLNFFNKHTNVKLDNKLIIADIYELGEENIKYGMYIFTELFWDKIKENRNIKKAIYMDEIWRMIGVTSNKEVASFIYKIFKTIRKYSGSSVAITQDISDLFSLDEGIYGKSILNNSSLKSFFSLEEENIKLLGENTNLSEKEKMEIKSLRRGECLLFAGENHLLIKVDTSPEEQEIFL